MQCSAAKRLNNQIHWDEAEVVQDQVNLKEAERELEAQGLKNSEELDDIKVNNEAVLEKIASTEESRLAQLKVGEQNADAVDEINRETHRHHQKLAKVSKLLKVFKFDPRISRKIVIISNKKRFRRL